MSVIYTSSGKTHYSSNKRKKNVNSGFRFIPMCDRTDDVAKVMASEIEIQRKLVFGSMMMVKAGILDKLEAQDPSKNARLKYDVFFRNVAADRK
jgi:hypothetical protein